MHKVRNKQNGFTLVEVSVAAAVTIIILSAIVGLQQIINQNQTLVFSQDFKQDIANAAMTVLVREIRTSRGGDNGAYTIQSANTQSLIFYSDVDYDGQTEKIRYFLDGTQLKKGVIQPSGYPVVYPANTEKIQIIADDVVNGSLPLFYYYTGKWPKVTTGNPMPTPADPDSIRLVRIHVRINPKQNDAEHDYVLESFADLRTLKDNL